MKKKVSRKNTRTNTKLMETIPEVISNKFLNEADIVVNEIIEKIISLSISLNFSNNINKNIPQSCFDFLRSTIDSYLNLNFISHDKEEINNSNNLSIISEKNDINIFQGIDPILKEENNDSNKKINLTSTEPSFEEQIFFKNCSKGENNWDLMEEPSSNKYDRYATTLVKFKEIEKERNRYNKNDKEILEEIDEENENISLNENNNNTNEIKETKEKNETQMKKTIKLSNVVINNINNNNTRPKKKNLNDIMSQFSFHDLDDNNDIYKEPTNIDYEKLRKEIQEKQNEENEEKKTQKNTKREVENKMKLVAEKNRQYIGKKITVDSNGEIVFIKGIKLDKLTKEFITTKSVTKLVKDEEKEKENEKSKSKKKKKRDNNPYNINNINNNIKNEEEKIETKEDKEKLVEKLSDMISEKNEDNNGDKTYRGRNQKLPKIRGGKFKTKENLDDLFKNKLLKRIEEGPIVLSGSNFEIMNMEVGVSLKEKEKYKSGGKDFYHKFNKFSLDNYNKQLKETLQVNSFMKSQTENDNLVKSDIVNNYINNLTDGYNSSINFTSNNSNINQGTVNSNKNFLTNFNTLSNFGNVSITRSKFTNNSLSPELKLSGTGLSLKSSMDKLNLITDRQERLAKKSQNIFKRRIFNLNSNKFTLPKLEEINKFSSEILTSSNWMSKRGVNNAMGKPFRFPEKPGFKEIVREMGINGKISRDRNNFFIRTQNTEIRK